ncbi:MAG: acyl-[acyl-carrier-protein] thioesterase [Lawsonibacter sp.]|jgi:medium-chain acyl-[acyl-carrier-protein] hydrolase
MSLYFEHTIRLTGMDSDGKGICKASALLNHLQIAATLAAEDGGFGRELLMERYGAFWMLARSWYRLERPLRWEDEITIRTWHRGDKAAMMYRDYDILVDGVPVGESVSGWVLANVETRKLMRLSAITELAGTGGGDLCKQRTLSKLRRPERLCPVERRLMRYSDTDINGHVNNTRYADFACDAVDMDRMEENYYLSQLQIGYLAECRPGDTITIERGEWGAPENGVYLCGVDEEKKVRFEAALHFEQVVP